MGMPLPPELLNHVASHLDDKNSVDTNGGNWSLLQFRLVCKAFATAGLPFLTSTVYLSTNLHDLRILDEISRHNLNTYIRTIICDDFNRKPVSFPFPDFDNQIQESLEEESIKRQCLDMAVFCTVLPRFPNLRKVVVKDLCRGPACWKSGDMDQLITYGWPNHVPEETDVWDQIVSPYHGFVTVIRGLSITRHEVHELIIDGVDFGLSHRIFNLDAQDHMHITRVFQGLRKLELHINSHADGESWHQETLSKGLLRSCLGQSNLLVVFGLSGFGDESCPLDFFEVFDQVIWLCLRRFTLSCFDIARHVHLANIFIAHRQTLQTVSLNAISLFGKLSWATFLCNLEKNQVEWKHFSSTGLWETDGDYCYKYRPKGEDVIGYLQGGGENPFATSIDYYPFLAQSD